MSAESPATATYGLVSDDFPEHMRGVFKLSEGTADYLIDNPRFFYKLIHATPEKCKDIFANQENFEYTRTIHENKKLIVDGLLPWKCVPPSLLEMTMTRARNDVLAGKNERCFSMKGLYQIAGRQFLVPCPELIKLCAQKHIMLNPQLVSINRVKMLRSAIRACDMIDINIDTFWKNMSPLIGSDIEGLPVGGARKGARKCLVTAVEGRDEACLTMLYFAKVYNHQAVGPPVKNALSKGDEAMLSSKLSKTDRKMMRRAKKQKPKQKKQKKQKKKKKYANKTAEQNRKFEILQLMRKLGLDKTIV